MGVATGELMRCVVSRRQVLFLVATSAESCDLTA